MLVVDKLNVFYGELHILHEVSLRLEEGKMVSVIGANGAGKSTLLNAIAGVIPARDGIIRFREKDIRNVPPYDVVGMGLLQVPGERLLFGNMTVMENLLLGGWILKDKKRKGERLDSVLRMFPILGERRRQKAGSLSGGEQQMLAIARALMADPHMLMLDEPSFGLAPIIVDAVFEIISEINRIGVSILLVEQDVLQSLAVADEAYVLENGRVVLEGNAKELMDNDHIKEAYVGI